jgi:hypothetical protein
MPIQWEPRRVDALADVRAVQVACGMDHSLVLSGGASRPNSGYNSVSEVLVCSENERVFRPCGRFRKEKWIVLLKYLGWNIPPMSLLFMKNLSAPNIRYASSGPQRGQESNYLSLNMQSFASFANSMDLSAQLTRYIPRLLPIYGIAN